MAATLAGGASPLSNEPTHTENDAHPTSTKPAYKSGVRPSGAPPSTPIFKFKVNNWVQKKHGDVRADGSTVGTAYQVVERYATATGNTYDIQKHGTLDQEHSVPENQLRLTKAPRQ